MDATTLDGGFTDIATDSARAFRVIMQAMARPAEIGAVGPMQAPAPLSDAAATLLLTLCDPETPVFLGQQHDTHALRQWLAFHTGAPVVGAAEAMFAVGVWDDLPLSDFAIGTPAYPDRSATLIVEMQELTNEGTSLRGPGIDGTRELSLPDHNAFAANAARFPLGLDFYFTCGTRLAGLPRSTRIS